MKLTIFNQFQSKGIIAKKDGVVGWYYGRYTEE